MSTTEKVHILAYVQRSKITDWKRLLNPYDDRPIPFLYGSDDDNVFAKYACKDAVLWVLAASPDNRPPSLVSKLKIIGRENDLHTGSYDIPQHTILKFLKKFKYVVVGDPEESKFYGYNNAARALLSLEVKWAKTQRTLSGEPACPFGTCDWKSSFARPLARPAIIAGDAAPLVEMDKRAGNCVFISWKHKDNKDRTQEIHKLAYALADREIFVWLDVLTMPPSVALRKKVASDNDLLTRLLRYGYERSNAMIAIETEKYREAGICRNWTDMEWKGDFKDKKTPCPPLFRSVCTFDPCPSTDELEPYRLPFRPGDDWYLISSLLRDKIIK